MDLFLVVFEWDEIKVFLQINKRIPTIYVCNYVKYSGAYKVRIHFVMLAFWKIYQPISEHKY